MASRLLKAVPRSVRVQNRAPTTNSTKASPVAAFFKLLGGVTAVSAASWVFILNEENKMAWRRRFNSNGFVQYASKQIETIAKPFTDPSREKLLPDWESIPGVPKNSRPPPTLILDLENTLMRAEWHPKHGWRYAKRPGVDKFLATLSRHYEMVIFSKQVDHVAVEVVNKLDPNGYAFHRLYRDSTTFVNGTHVKDISRLNRNLKTAILIDDDPKAYALNPRNAIPIAPFVDPRDRSDRALLDLIPFLQAVAVEKVQDIPALLDSFRNDDGLLEDLPSKYAARVHAIRQEHKQQQQKGFGGLIRHRASSRTGPPSGIKMGKPSSSDFK